MIYNNTKFAIAVLAHEYTGIIEPGGKLDVPKDVMDAWVKSPMAQAFMQSHGISCDFSSIEAFQGMPIKQALDLIDQLDDLSELKQLVATETRAKVSVALKTRIAGLGG